MWSGCLWLSPRTSLFAPRVFHGRALPATLLPLDNSLRNSLRASVRTFLYEACKQAPQRLSGKDILDTTIHKVY